MIIAFDFDGTLVEDRFPEIGPADEDMIRIAKALRVFDYEVILWTSRAGERLTEAVNWCREHGLYFDAVNDNSPTNIAMYSKEYPVPSRKVYADVYVDDKSLGYNREQAIESLTNLLVKGRRQWKRED